MVSIAITPSQGKKGFQNHPILRHTYNYPPYLMDEIVKKSLVKMVGLFSRRLIHQTHIIVSVLVGAIPVQEI